MSESTGEKACCMSKCFVTQKRGNVSESINELLASPSQNRLQEGHYSFGSCLRSLAELWLRTWKRVGA